MGKKRVHKKQPPAKKPQESVFREAWENMTGDFNKLLPEKIQNKSKKKFVLWLFVLELLVLGVAGRFIYEWWVG